MSALTATDIVRGMFGDTVADHLESGKAVPCQSWSRASGSPDLRTPIPSVDSAALVAQGGIR